MLGYLIRGGTRNFVMGGLTLSMKGLKFDFKGTTNAKDLQEITFHLPTGG